MNNKYLIESRDIKFPKRRYEETDFLFGYDVGVSPKAPRRTAGYGSIQV